MTPRELKVLLVEMFPESSVKIEVEEWSNRFSDATRSERRDYAAFILPAFGKSCAHFSGSSPEELLAHIRARLIPATTDEQADADYRADEAVTVLTE